MKQIVHIPNDILTTPAQTVIHFDKKLRQLVRDLKETLRLTVNPKGVGLAAPQIGNPSRVFVTRPTEESEIRVFVNPEIIRKSEDLTDGVPERDNKLEGCLSIPDIWGKVRRVKSLKIRYRDETGKIHTETAKGFLATIMQHETDHLDGILFTRRVLEQKEKFYQTKHDKSGKDVLEEVDII